MGGDLVSTGARGTREASLGRNGNYKATESET